MSNTKHTGTASGEPVARNKKGNSMGYVFPKFNADRSPVPVRRYNFPKGFVFGASTSAYQIEGATDQAKYGRGPSIWEDYFIARPLLDNGAVACDHYNRMKEDVAMIKRMGHKVYRFSVSWPRIIPNGVGAINEQGLQFYSDLVDELLAQGIEPYLTLYHWDLPRAMEEIGGWTSRAVAEHFANFAEVVVRRLGDRVQKWCTFNEPEVIVAGYIGDGLAPGLSNPKLRVTVAHTLMVAHGLATKRIRAINSSLDVGIVVNLVPVEPATKAATKAARKMWQRNYAIYLDGILKGEYSATVLEEAAEQGVSITAEDMALIAQPIDYLGINWYLRLVVNARGRVVKVPAAEETLMGWEICPAALTRMLLAMNKEYILPPIYITENGAALKDEHTAGGVHDNRRMLYTHEHLSAIELAIAGGVDMRGYFAWSLMDNLEWSLGYSKTFGMVHVDRQTMVRTVKDSGLWYRAMIKANRR
ncbi:GH1 family beta-glucosidase [soil metagenome]